MIAHQASFKKMKGSKRELKSQKFRRLELEKRKSNLGNEINPEGNYLNPNQQSREINEEVIDTEKIGLSEAGRQKTTENNQEFIRLDQNAGSGNSITLKVMPNG